MEEKERYEFGQRTLFYSGEELTTFDGFNLDDFMRIICKLLNQQDKEIIKLRGENQQLKQSQNQVAIKELEKLKDDLLENFGQYSPFANRVDLVVKINEQIENLKGE